MPAHPLADLQRPFEIYETTYFKSTQIRPAKRFASCLERQRRPLDRNNGEAAAIDGDAVTNTDVRTNQRPFNGNIGSIAQLFKLLNNTFLFD